jgi:diacylglycerol kinase (ATP)
MWLLVVNQCAGKGDGLSRLAKFEAICQANNIAFQRVSEADSVETEDRIKTALRESSISVVVAFGGDGLVSICLQAIATRQIGLMVVPAGTGNDFARGIGVLGKSEQEIFDLITKSQARQIDAAKARYSSGEKWYLQIMSTGFDAQVNALANQIKWPRGRGRYTIAMLIILAKFKPIEYEIIFNDEKRIVSAMLALVANGVTYGGGMKISPNSSYEDGILDLIYIEPVSRLTLLSIFPKVFNGSHINHPKVKILKSNQFTLIAKTRAYADGELIGDLPIDVQVIPRAISTWICP